MAACPANFWLSKPTTTTNTQAVIPECCHCTGAEPLCSFVLRYNTVQAHALLGSSSMLHLLVYTAMLGPCTVHGLNAS